MLGMRAEAEGGPETRALPLRTARTAEDAPEGDAPADADTEPVAEAPAEPEAAEPQGVPSFDDEPQMPDTEGAVAENHEALRLSLVVRQRLRPARRTRATCRSSMALGGTWPPRSPCRLCRRSRLTRLSPSCGFTQQTARRQKLRCGYNGQHSNGGHRGACRRGMIMGKTFSFVPGKSFAAPPLASALLWPRARCRDPRHGCRYRQRRPGLMRDTYDAEKLRRLPRSATLVRWSTPRPMTCAPYRLARERMDQLREQPNDAIRAAT
ncbi:MAG: hypothetical protein ACLU0O_02225 [Collinsella sp.]